MQKKKTKFWISFSVALIILLSSVFGGYLVINNFLVPKYFGKYGVNNIKELVGVVSTIYTVPDEEKIITNGFSKFDLTSATEKLKNAGFPILTNGDIDYEQIKTGGYTRTPNEDFVDDFILLSDKEVASILDEVLSSGLLDNSIPELSYFKTLNISIKQIIVSPINETLKNFEQQNNDKNSQEKNIIATTNNANLTITIKLDVENSKKLIAETLNMPEFLVDWIVPNTIYATSSLTAIYDTKTETRSYTNPTLSINGKTAKQSEVLLNMLISFVFANKNLTISDFANQIGSLAIDGLNLLGDISFAKIKVAQTTIASPSVLNGVVVTIN